MALRYLSIVERVKLLDRIGLLKYKPKWRGKREDLITVGGEAAKDDKKWYDSKRIIPKGDKRKILAYVIEVLVNLVMASHVYEFEGKYFLQVDGGPIGLRLTACLASLIMKMWNSSWSLLLRREGISMIDMCRYVDDVRNFSETIITLCKMDLVSLYV